METDFRSSPRRTNSSPIAAARIEKGLTQAQLAEAVGTTQGQIARWETGARNPKVPALMRIAQALGVPLEQLI